MSLFGAATSGVDPQTGSYLSKEQRVAMFRASQGRSSTGGAGSGQNKRANVQASSAIVVANKMTSVVQTLQNFSQQNVNNVAEQVQQNRQNLENLYANVAAARAAEAKEERLETVQKRGERENYLRQAKESLIEGISKVASGVAGAVTRVGEAVTAPLSGLWEKLRNALVLLAGAWALDNLPAIISAIQDFDLGAFGETLTEKITSMRGVWSILDDVLKGVKTQIGRLARSIGRLARWVGGKIVSISRRVFGALKNFVVGVTRRIVSKLGSLVSDAAKGLGDIVKPALQRGGQFLDDITRPARQAISKSPVGRMFGALTDFAVKGGQQIMKTGGELLEGAKTSVSTGLGKLQETTTGIKPRSDGVRANWIQKALAPIGDAFPHLKNALKGVAGVAKRVMSIVPGLGFAIDLALNKGVAGQDWTEAILRSLGSSVLGGLSAAAGAKAGGIAGASIGALAGGIGAIPGAAIGSAIGAILAGIIGGAAGDQIGAATYEFTTGETRTENRPMGTGVVESITGQAPDATLGTHNEVEPKNFDYKISGSSGSTERNGDLGLTSPDAMASEPELNYVELPPTMTRVQPEGEQQAPATEAEQIFDYDSADSDMDFYRDLAARIYQVN